VRLAIVVQPPGGEPERHVVEGVVSAGGSRADGLLVPGLAPAALRLAATAAGLVVEPSAPGVHVGGHPVAPGERRLLRAGERAETHGAILRLDVPGSSPAAGTRAAAAALLREAAAGRLQSGARLVVVTGPAAGALHPLRAEQTLGRGRDATIRLPDPRASRVHARLRLGPDGASVEDLGSKNGVRVNGVRIEPRRGARVSPGDEILLGDTVVALEVRDPAGDAARRTSDAAASGAPHAARARLRLAAAALLALSASALALAAS
jgi:hypothetical protein